MRTLERRVKERTEELTRLNAALARAKGEADEANISKTRFLAAASHDILQPLNAARLYVTSLVERQGGGEDARLVSNVDASLEAVEEILGALLDISRLDSGAMRPEILIVPHGRIDAPARSRVRAARTREGARAHLRAEHALGALRPAAAAPAAAKPRLQRHQVHAAGARADRLPARQRRGCASTSTTPGSAFRKSKKREIFREFHRLDQGAKVARGLGLGLSIVERIARVLDHRIALESKPGRGSHFSVTVPLAPALPLDATAREPRRVDVEPARRHAGAVHRQRAEDPRRHGDTARRLGLPRAQGARPQVGARDGERRQGGAERASGRLPPRRGQRHRGHRGAALAFRHRSAGDPDHRRPHAGGARGSARARHPGAEQAAQAGGTARADRPMARAAHGGARNSSVDRQRRLRPLAGLRSWPPR